MTPPCTTLTPVRLQICKTWRSLLPHGASASQDTQCSFDLSNLLGAWQHDALNSVLESVQNELRVALCPVSLQPSTSSCNPPSHHANTYTGWDADRIRHTSVEQFNIPVCHLPMPEEEAQSAFQKGSETPNGILNPPEDTITDSPNTAHHLETVQPILGHFNANTFPPEILEGAYLGSEDTLSQDDINEDKVTELNPWDAFSPPFEMLRTSSCSDESMTSEAIPPKALTDTAGITIQVEGVPLVAIIQMSSKGSSEISQTSEQSKEQTSFPPYQKPQSTPSLVSVSNSSASGSTTTEPFGTTLRFPRIKNRCSPLLVSDQENLPVEEEMETQEEVAQRICRTVKRKINHCSSDMLIAEGEKGVHSSGSPPSWLFETQRASRAKVRSSLKQTKSTGTVSGVHSTVHSDGTQFSFAYKHSGQLLQDLSKFKVAADMLRWAVKYLTVTNQTDKAQFGF